MPTARAPCQCERCLVETFCFGFIDGKEARLLSILTGFNEEWPVSRVDVTPATIVAKITTLVEAIFSDSINHGRVLAALGMLYDVHQEHKDDSWYPNCLIVDPLVVALMERDFSLSAFKKHFEHGPRLCIIV